VRGELIRVGFSAHNYYVQTLFNLGLVGLLANVALYGSILIALIRGLKHPSLGEQSAAMLILIVSQLAYYFPYGVNTFQGLVLGVAASLSLTLEGQRRAAGIGSLNASR
jgi:O-antigen ligase